MAAESWPGRDVNELCADKNLYLIDSDWYYANEDMARQDFQLHARQIDHLIPFWFGITEEGGLNSDVDQEAEGIAEEAGSPFSPSCTTTLAGNTDHWYIESLQTRLSVEP